MPARFGPIPGLKIGHAQDDAALTGCTVFIVGKGAEQGMVAACELRGGAVGERELATLEPMHLVDRIHGLVFAGGSAFGLDAATGVVRWLEEHGIGFDTSVARVPIVPSAILFDLRLGAASRRPDAAMGYAAAEAAVESPVAEGNVGAGTGTSVGKLFGIAQAMKSGIGCWAEEVTGAAGEPARVAALAVVNAFGDVRDPDTGRIIAGTRTGDVTGPAVEVDSLDYGLLDTAAAMRRGFLRKGFADPKPSPELGTSTVLVAVATDAALSRAECKRLAIMAAAGMGRALSPAHTTFDGDIVFALSLGIAKADVNALGAAACEAVARAIVRGVTLARPAGGLPGLAAR